jgi:CoA:oxalate CoA-transferase
MCSISSLGRTGRLANLPGYDYVGAAYSGVLDMTGFPDRTPVFPQVGLGDISTGVHAMGAILAALLYRERTGKGQHVEASLLDSYFSYHDLNVHASSASRGAIRPRRSGSHHFMVCPAGVFQGKKRGILILAQLDQSVSAAMPRDGAAGVDKRSTFQGYTEPRGQRGRTEADRAGMDRLDAVG